MESVLPRFPSTKKRIGYRTKSRRAKLELKSKMDYRHIIEFGASSQKLYFTDAIGQLKQTASLAWRHILRRTHVHREKIPNQ